MLLRLGNDAPDSLEALLTAPVGRKKVRQRRGHVKSTAMERGDVFRTRTTTLISRAARRMHRELQPPCGT